VADYFSLTIGRDHEAFSQDYEAGSVLQKAFSRYAPVLLQPASPTLASDAILLTLFAGLNYHQHSLFLMVSSRMKCPLEAAAEASRRRMFPSDLLRKNS
jgi:hypothetical protein